MNRRYYYVLAGMGLFALEMAAQPRSWSNVTAISSGTEIRITGPRPGTVSGTLRSATDDSLALVSSAGQEAFERKQITRVSVRKQGHRARNTLIGLGVGAGTGLVIGVASDMKCAPNGCFLGNNIAKTVLTPFGALVGALAGLLIPSGGWREVYRQ